MSNIRKIDYANWNVRHYRRSDFSFNGENAGTTGSWGVMSEKNRAFEIESMIAKLTREIFPDVRLKDLTPEESTLYALYHLSRVYSGMLLGQSREQSKHEAWTTINFIRDAVRALEEQKATGEL